MTKRERDERRRLEAIRRMRLMHLLSLLLHVQVCWEQGFEGGGEAWGIRYMPVTLEGRRVGMTKMLMSRVNKARVVMFSIAGLKEGFDRRGKGFYEDCEAMRMNLSMEIIKALPEEASYTDGLIVLTYLVSTFLYDLQILEDDQRPELTKLVKAFNSFADWLMPKESELVGPFNAVYWATRDEVLCHPDWTRGGTLEWTPSEQELWLKEKA